MAVMYKLSDFKRAHAAAQQPSDEDLLAAIARGDKRAMHTLFHRHHMRIHRFVARFTGDASLAEDVVNEVFLDVWRRADAFLGKSRVSTWLLSIARHKALSMVRRGRSRAQLHERVAEDLIDPHENPEAAMHRKSWGDLMKTCLTRLTPAHREIIDLRYFHEKSLEEVAQIVGVSARTVKTRMFYARGRLAKVLKAAGIRDFQAC